MPDQHEAILNNFYKDIIQKAKQYLESKYSLTICNQEDEDISEITQTLSHTNPNYKEFWKIEVTGSYRHFTLILAIPDTFPDSFPKIYLTKKEYQKIYPIPHLDKNRFVCTRDPEVTVLNDKKPEEAVENLIQIAIGILESGIKKENQIDFVKEFLAYWNEKAIHFFLSLFVPGDDIKYLRIFRLHKKIFGSKCIVSDSEKEVQRWLEAFHIDLIEEKSIKALYLPLAELLLQQLEKNEDVVEIFKNSNDKKHIKVIESYLNQNRNHYIIITSFLINGERILFGWRHKGWRGIQFKGFSRKNHVPLNIRMLNSETRYNQVEKIEIIRLDKERIFKRGGTMTTITNRNISVAIIGCGSLGSYLAMSLSRCGISKYLLIDKDYLKPENTPRHLCGFLEASQGMKKVDAVKKRLTDHFSHIECHTYDADVLQWLQKEENSLKEYDLTIMAIGNMSVERRINFLLKHGTINKPVVFLWIEPFGVGGQILYIHPYNGGCYNCCFDNEGNFLYSITMPGDKSKFQRRESGCQSTFLPYSSLHIEQFASISCKKILTALEKGVEASTLYTWIGDIEEFEELGYRINPIYDAQLPYRIVERKIIQQEWCSICGKDK